jgi:hypothetical protein
MSFFKTPFDYYQTSVFYPMKIGRNLGDQTVLLRCRIGHTKINHSYFLTNDNAPFCVGCNANFTVKHFLLECHNFSQARNRFYSLNSLKELFNTIPSKNIIDCLK